MNNVALMITSLWAIGAPYADRWVGLEVAVRPIVEVVDHVVPGLIVAVLAAGALAMKRRLPFVAAAVAVLAGFWMVVTHLPLLTQAQGGGVSFAAALWHTSPGVAVLVVALVGAVGAWRESDKIA